MVTFTGIGCGGADSFLGGVSIVDIRVVPSFLRTSVSGLGSVWLYAQALPGGEAGVVGSGMPRRRPVGADRREGGRGAATGRLPGTAVAGSRSRLACRSL